MILNQLINNVCNTIKKYNMLNHGDKVVVGLSGGADSCVLLDVLCRLKDIIGISVVVAHLNHGIRGEEARRDQNFSEIFSKHYNVQFVTSNVNVPEYSARNKISSEMAGRQLRYKFFDEVCKNYNCNKIAVAHNLNDRAETILLNLIRGSAASGMEGIKPTNGNIIRPLVETMRKDIESYAQLNNIDYVTDSTNLEDIYSRNIVRNKILSQMCSINQNAIENIIRCSDIITCENEYINHELDKENVFVCKNDEVHINKIKFIEFHSALKRRCVLEAIRKLNGNSQNISAKQIDLVTNNLKTGNQFQLGNNVQVYITGDSIIFSDKKLGYAEYTYTPKIPGEIEIKETNSVYKFEIVPKYERTENSLCISLDKVDTNNIVLRTKKDGDYFKPFGMTSHKKVKKFFIDSKISLYERNLYPLLIYNNDVLGIIPLRVSEDYKVDKNTKKILKITKTGGTYDER